LRTCALIDALHELFELLWQRASPIALTKEGNLRTGDTSQVGSADDEIIMSLLAAGLSDKAIAHELNVSLRTLRRRTTDLLKMIGARTRYQAGWLAASQRKPR
jgi:DNA-binding NarL/FixJ family response regulator